MKLIHALLLFASCLTVASASDLKTYDFASGQDGFEAVLIHIEINGNKVSGDISIFGETAESEQRSWSKPHPFQGDVTSDLQITVKSVNGSLPRLKLPFLGPLIFSPIQNSGAISPSLSYDRVTKGTQWQMKRTSEGLVLEMPMLERDGSADDFSFSPIIWHASELGAWKIAQKELREEATAEAASDSDSKPTSPATSSPQPVHPIPSSITIEPMYTWDVDVWVGRKYQWTKDTYESPYTHVHTEVQAKTRSEAESLAISKSYTARSALLGTPIKVEPAGTPNAQFRCTKAEATRQ